MDIEGTIYEAFEHISEVRDFTRGDLLGFAPLNPSKKELRIVSVVD